MAQKNAQQAAANWKSAMQSPQTAANYKAGIQNCTVNPMALAATDEAMQKYQEGVARSITTGKRARSLNNAQVSTWKNNSMTIGAQNLSSGATKAQAKYQANIAPYAAVWPAMKAASAALPGGSASAAKAKFGAALDVLMNAAGYTS